MIDRSIRQHLSWFDTLKKHLLTTALCVALPVCSVSASAENLTIGFSQIGSESGWRTSETESIKAEAVKWLGQ